MTLVAKGYSDELDHNRVMNFLRETFNETGSLENWLPPRFENNSREMDPGIRLWEDNGEIVGLAVPEKPLFYFIQLHPNYIGLYEEIVEWIEKYTRENRGEGGVELRIIELEGDPEREAFLVGQGFTRRQIYGIFRIRDVNAPIPDFQLPEGFSVRSVEASDFDEIATCIRQVFGHGEWFTGEVLKETAQASFYHKDLDLVVVNDDGKIVSFCTFRLDPQSRITELEPMGTLEEYRSRGLARALLYEGFKRLRKYNPTFLYIGGAANTPAANRLYEVTGFTDKINLYTWEKKI
jgi:ribosomal protein S18 acetylase RimI-like enzyme